MSSMHRKGFLGVAVLAVGAVALSAPVASESLARWEIAPAELVAAQPPHSAQVVDRWQLLNGTDRMRFDHYPVFVPAYPGSPHAARLRRHPPDNPDIDAISPPTPPPLSHPPPP